MSFFSTDSPSCIMMSPPVKPTSKIPPLYTPFPPAHSWRKSMELVVHLKHDVKEGDDQTASFQILLSYSNCLEELRSMTVMGLRSIISRRCKYPLQQLVLRTSCDTTVFHCPITDNGRQSIDDVWRLADRLSSKQLVVHVYYTYQLSPPPLSSPSSSSSCRYPSCRPPSPLLLSTSPLSPLSPPYSLLSSSSSSRSLQHPSSRTTETSKHLPFGSGSSSGNGSGDGVIEWKAYPILMSVNDGANGSRLYVHSQPHHTFTTTNYFYNPFLFPLSTLYSPSTLTTTSTTTTTCYQPEEFFSFESRLS